MNQDDVIRMAREAGFANAVWTPNFVEPFVKFAALVAAQEREACANVAESMAPEFGEKGWAARDRGDFTLSLGMLGVEFQLKECAAAIRARASKENA